MRTRSPVSRSSFAVRLSAFDATCALVAPLLALWIRGAPALSLYDWPSASLYCGISFGFAVIAFVAFRIRDGVTHLFSVNDALELAKAVIISELMTCLVLFSMTRLDGIPRTTPIIHALLLATALVAGRLFARTRRTPPEQPIRRGRPRPEHIVVIGANRLSSLYISFLRAYEPEQYRIIGLLDDRPEMNGRSLAGVRVLGPVNHLLPIIEEFKEHGISADRVLVGGNADLLSVDAIGQVKGICNAQEMRLDYIPQLLGLDRAVRVKPPIEAAQAASVAALYSPPRYHRFKRVLDVAIGLPLALLLLPIFLLVAGIVLFDVGVPVLFWQQRVGRNGQSFQLHKFRTLKPSFDWRGRPLAEEERLSSVGRILRLVRLDELPQLLNVLIGDMSLIGPRPLLPRDQPPNAVVRLSVRPGITGWAQVHGGTLLTPDEKNTLDEWYVRNASLRVDLTIVFKTIGILLAGDRRPAPRSADVARDDLDVPSPRRSLSGT